MRPFLRMNRDARLALTSGGRGGLASFAQRLVRTPSPSTQEEAVAGLIQDELARLGVRQVRVDRIGNVVVRIGSAERPVLFYDAHMDTVEVTDPDSWRYDPHGGVIRNGVLYGLGATDMKGSLAAMVYAAGLVQAHEHELKGSVMLAFVVQEEPCEGLAVRMLLEEEEVKPDWVVLGEPTDLQISRGHRGRVMLRVTTRGRSCHASQPHLGDNAVYAAARLIFGVEMMQNDFPKDALLGPGTVAVTDIRSRSASLNAVPDMCTFYLDRRLTLGETASGALAQVEALIAREGLAATAEITQYRATSYTGHPCRAKEAFPAWALEADHPLISRLKQTVARTLGKHPRVIHWDFSTDGVYTMGQANIPTVGFGPGGPNRAHTIQEQVRLKDLVRAAEVYAAFALDMLS